MNKRNSTNASKFASLSRVQNSRFSVLICLLPVLLAGQWQWQMVWTLFSIMLVYGLAAVINDINDIEVDRSNSRNLPLVTGELSTRQAWYFAGYLAALLIGCNIAAVQPATLLISGFLVMLLTIYSIKPLSLSRRGLWGTATLGLSYFTVPYLGGLSLASLDFLASDALLLAVASCLLAMAPLLYKDFKDEVGDKQHGKNTPLILYGSRIVRLLSVIFCFIGLLLGLIVNITWASVLMAITLAALMVVVSRSNQRGYVLQVYGLLSVVFLSFLVV